MTSADTAATSAPATPSQNTPAPASDAADTTAQIHTYHCLCTQLLLASTTPLASLPRRGGPHISDSSSSPLDRAHILPLPASPPTQNPSQAHSQASDAPGTETPPPSPHYALTLSLSSDRSATIVQRDDGLEKRYLARCGRCRVVVGYWLDRSQFAASAGKEAGKEVQSTPRAVNGRREDLLFLLPGGLLSTEDMAAGKRRDGTQRVDG